MVSVVSSGSEEREFEPHSGSDEVTLFPSSVYHQNGNSNDGGSYQSIGLTAKLPQLDGCGPSWVFMHLGLLHELL